MSEKLYTRMMEVFAGFLTHVDFHYGRLFEFLKSIGQWDNTLIMFVCDNGASAGRRTARLGQRDAIFQQYSGVDRRRT